jgi:hypothetical protein
MAAILLAPLVGVIASNQSIAIARSDLLVDGKTSASVVYFYGGSSNFGMRRIGLPMRANPNPIESGAFFYF